ncbi:Uu.00g019100.m01.CDS01 [Anthostomella pinea]|uniref:Uu.00g019100.m01.CDS01 n=1 Tax=Anthostomella pinea TaxID=933095 RepID=A0AAI8YQS8_9PEZI|nr:Uu.00g019100.m01.CDS01 [Anthostomella pinea]
MARSALLNLTLLAGTALAIQAYPPAVTTPTPTAAPPFRVPGHIKQATVTSVAAGCSTASAVLDACADVLAGYDEAALSSCLCCAGTTYMPDYFNDAASECANYYATALPEDSDDADMYSALASYCVQPGDSAGDLCSSPPTITTDVSPSTTTFADACFSAADLVQTCISETASFTALPASSQAECLCYRSAFEGTNTLTTTWQPNYFDGYVSECAEWASDTNTEVYSAYTSWENLCSSYGDILSVGSMTISSNGSATTSSSDSVTTSSSDSESTTTTSSSKTSSKTSSSTTASQTATTGPADVPPSQAVADRGGAAAGVEASMVVVFGIFVGSLWLML